jgi:hypothetical protein
LFVLLYFFWWSLYCLSFDLRHLINYSFWALRTFHVLSYWYVAYVVVDLKKKLNDVSHASDHMSWTFPSMKMEILRLWNWNNLMLNCCVFYDQSDWPKKVIAGHIYRDQTILRRSDNPTNILKYNVWNDNVLLYILYA